MYSTKLLVRYKIAKAKLVFDAVSYNHGLFRSIKKGCLIFYLITMKL